MTGQPLAYLQHNHAYLFHALDNGVGSARYSHCALRRVWQHVPCYLHLGSCGLEQRQGKESVTVGQATASPKSSDSLRERTHLETFCLSFARYQSGV